MSSESAVVTPTAPAATPTFGNLDIRRHYAREALNLSGRGLEFGAYDRPLFPPGDFDVQYADYYATDELRAFAARDGADPSKIVEVRHVVKGADFAADISGKFDFIIASHVIEHVPDMVRWFANARRLLNEHGRVFLIVPDKRFTFDCCRPLSTLGEVLGAHFEQRTAPSFASVFDNLYLFKSVSAVGMWSGQQDPYAADGRYDVPTALRLARDFWERKDASIHSHVFTYSSFLDLLRHLRAAGLLPLKLAASHDVYRPFNEFYVTLERE